MVVGILVPLGAVFTQIFQYLRNLLAFSDIFFEGLLFGVIFFVLVFLPGLKYYKISKSTESNKLENWAVWLTIATVILEVILFILLSLTGDSEGVVWGMAIFGGFLLIPYAVGVLLLVINWFKQK